MTKTAELDDLTPALAGDLAAAASGIAFIYHCLGAVVARWKLRDALVVVDDGNTRQVFRSGRRVPEGRWALSVIGMATPGLHTDPVVVEGAHELAAAADLCRIALRLDRLRYDSQHDGLTGLFNRRSFDELLSQAVDRSQRYGWTFSLVLLDLDNFKVLNDQLGHHAGDEVLRSIGDEMRRALRRGDVAARIGGDEFALILPEADPEFAPELLNRLRAGLRGGGPGVGFSIGVALCPEDGFDAAVLHRLADQRLYEAKGRV